MGGNLPIMLKWDERQVKHCSDVKRHVTHILTGSPPGVNVGLGRHV